MSAGPARVPRVQVDGVLLLDKPAGITSQSAVSRVKRLFNATKAGHTGTLDPMATGLLPIVFGEATKFGNALLDAPKSYLATVRLGTTTTTGDLEGEVTSSGKCEINSASLEAALERFRGEIEQTPPMYSALKRDGRPLYEYARKGIEVDRAPRRVTISALELRGHAATDVTIAVRCSKGTYIRVLAEDLGKALGCGACLAALRRTGVGSFDVADATDLPTLEVASPDERLTRLLPADAMLRDLPVAELDESTARRLMQGHAIAWQASQCRGLMRVYGPAGAFLGIAEVGEAGGLKPRRLVSTNAADP